MCLLRVYGTVDLVVEVTGERARYLRTRRTVGTSFLRSGVCSIGAIMDGSQVNVLGGREGMQRLDTELERELLQ